MIVNVPPKARVNVPPKARVNVPPKAKLNAPPKERGALPDIPKDGCEGDKPNDCI